MAMESQFLESVMERSGDSYVNISEVFNDAFLTACQHDCVDIVELFVSKKKVNVMDRFTKFITSTTNKKIIDVIFKASSVRNRHEYKEILTAAIVHNRYDLVNNLLNMNITNLD
jgi:hypothetical protein